MSTTQKPVALRLADKYEIEGFLQDHRYAKDYWCSQAAVELRRQHARIAELEEMLRREVQHSAELMAARIAYASEFEPDADGDPDVGNIHANIRALKAQLSAIGAGGVEPLRKQNVGDSEDNLTMAGAIIMQREADARDAARYRWLRNQMLAVDFDWGENGITALCFEMPEDGCAYGGDCDQNIDAAIAAQAKQGDAQP